jgi:hypothetical protein
MTDEELKKRIYEIYKDCKHFSSGSGYLLSSDETMAFWQRQVFMLCKFIQLDEIKLRGLIEIEAKLLLYNWVKEFPFNSLNNRIGDIYRELLKESK